MSELDNILQSAARHKEIIEAKKIADEQERLDSIERLRSHEEELSPMVELSNRRAREFAELMIQCEIPTVHVFTTEATDCEYPQGILSRPKPVYAGGGWVVRQPQIFGSDYHDDMPGIVVTSEGITYTAWVCREGTFEKAFKPEAPSQTEWPDENALDARTYGDEHRIIFSTDAGLELLGEFVAKSGILDK